MIILFETDYMNFNCNCLKNILKATFLIIFCNSSDYSRLLFDLIMFVTFYNVKTDVLFSYFLSRFLFVLLLVNPVSFNDLIISNVHGQMIKNIHICTQSDNLFTSYENNP